MSKNLKILGSGLGIILLAIAGIYSYYYYQIQKGNLVYWEGSLHWKNELEQKYGSKPTDVPAKNTPEEVYAEFRLALMEVDYSRVLLCFSEKSQSKYKAYLQDHEKINYYKTLPGFSLINKSKYDSTENKEIFHYKIINNNLEKTYYIEFIKNENG
jgi:hypothetical protein